MPGFKSLSPLVVCSLLLVLAVSTSWCLAAESAKRARPPRWSKDVQDAFFENASDQLVGARPKLVELGGANGIATQQPGGPSGMGQGNSNAEKWSTLISADTLTAEIKRVNNQLAQTLKKSSTFQAGGNTICRHDFGLLAILFGVIEQFDEDVRWQRSAKQMQARCFRASQNCQVASTRSYKAAKETQQVLAELLRGQAPSDESSPEGQDPLMVEINQIMQSMEFAMKERLGPALSNSSEFRKQAYLAHEQAQLLAMLAKLAQDEEYGYEDDETYLNEAELLIQAAAELSQAAQQKNYESARKAAGRIGQACSRCHEGYR